VLRVDYGGAAFMLMGDLEEARSTLRPRATSSAAVAIATVLVPAPPFCPAKTRVVAMCPPNSEYHLVAQPGDFVTVAPVPQGTKKLTH
jgi:hypothetical protein